MVILFLEDRKYLKVFHCHDGRPSPASDEHAELDPDGAKSARDRTLDLSNPCLAERGRDLNPAASHMHAHTHLAIVSRG